MSKIPKQEAKDKITALNLELKENNDKVINASDYLKLPNVISVGGSFPLPKESIKNNDWKSITKIAKIFAQ